MAYNSTKSCFNNLFHIEEANKISCYELYLNVPEVSNRAVGKIMCLANHLQSLHKPEINKQLWLDSR